MSGNVCECKAQVEYHWRAWRQGGIILWWRLTNHRPCRDSVWALAHTVQQLSSPGVVESQVHFSPHSLSFSFLFAPPPPPLLFCLTVSHHITRTWREFSQTYHCECPPGLKSVKNYTHFTLQGPKANKHLSIMWKCVLGSARFCLVIPPENSASFKRGPRDSFVLYPAISLGLSSHQMSLHRKHCILRRNLFRLRQFNQLCVFFFKFWDEELVWAGFSLSPRSIERWNSKTQKLAVPFLF